MDFHLTTSVSTFSSFKITWWNIWNHLRSSWYIVEILEPVGISIKRPLPSSGVQHIPLATRTSRNNEAKFHRTARLSDRSLCRTHCGYFLLPVFELEISMVSLVQLAQPHSHIGWLNSYTFEPLSVSHLCCLKRRTIYGLKTSSKNSIMNNGPIA